ncbi:hypothetical protein MJO29_008842 [Puccinia striiformis f. sp. tritici]|nr:hypothetical protein MJO29_008842 [Puccinia striiformis f. sp. tritici]
MCLFPDLVISAFQGLMRVIKELAQDFSSTRPNQMNLQELDHMFKLESRLLPQLQKQLNAILESLVALDSPDGPCSRLQSILDIQPQLLVTLKEIVSAICILDPGLNYTIGHIDQEYNELKPYRLNWPDEKGFIDNKLKDLFTQINPISNNEYEQVDE